MTEFYGYVYLTTNLVNGRKYIGQHKGSELDEKYLGSGTALLGAIQKYGRENFTNELVQFYKTREELNEGEIYHIALNNAVKSREFYNIANGGEGGSLSKENHPMWGVRGELHWNYGKNRSEETKKKIGDAHRGEKSHMFGRTEELHWNYGKPMSEAQKEKLSKAHSGKKLSEEHKENIALANKGKKHTDETKNKISEANKGLRVGSKSPLYDGKSPHARKVICLDTGEVFNSISGASRATGANKKTISLVCTGKNKTSGGLRWAYYNEYLEQQGA